MSTSASATVAAHLLTYARTLGVEFIFTNLGSDHPAFIQAFALLDEDERMPEVVCCPHEMTALSAAHGYAMITRRPQLVLVHVDVGTQNLGCSVHNIARARVPSIIVAGLSPLTAESDRPGDRTEFIHYTQDVPNQPDIVRQYMKWTYELRAAETVHEVLQRAFQMASSAPQGPVYLCGAREIWEEELALSAPKLSPPSEMGGLPAPACEGLLQALEKARRPLVITSYLGRSPHAVACLQRLSEQLSLAVAEVSPHCMNFPGDHGNHVGYQRNRHVDEADLILVLDADVPWLPKMVRPAADTPVYLIDPDPLKQGIGLWNFPLEGSYQADSAQALEQLLAGMQARGGPEPDVLDARRAWIKRARKAVEVAPATRGTAITPAGLSEAVAELVDDDTIVLVEAPSSGGEILPRLRMSRPQSLFLSGGSGLGWGINAAIGAKLACPEKTVISLVGDGCYFFGVPSSAYWVARHYDTPTLTVIYNNGGWNSPKHSNDLVHAQGGRAGATDRYWITIGRDARLEEIAKAAGDAAAFAVSDPAQLSGILREALAAVRQGRSAVVNVMLAPISQQRIGRRKARLPI